MIRLTLAMLLAALTSQFASAQTTDKATSIVLVHGAFVDGSGWKLNPRHTSSRRRTE